MIGKNQILFNKYYALITNCNLLKFIAIQFLVITIFSMIIKLVFYFFSIDIGINQVVISFNNSPILIKVLVLIILGPFLETFIFQSLPYLVLSKFPLLKNKKFILIFSALLFGISHTYSVGYVVYAFFIGAFLMFSYLSRLKKGDSFQTVFTIHILINSIAFLIDLISQR